jgi:DNA processing protein
MTAPDAGLPARGEADAPGTRSCDACLARAWLLARLEGHLESARAQIQATLTLADEELIEAVGGRSAREIRAELAALDLKAARKRARAAGLDTVCRCDPGYPQRLLDLAAPPAELHVAGGLARLQALLGRESVAIVGSRAASEYGHEVARSLGRALSAAGVTVLSGMALGVDAAAHAGALEVGGTVAVLPGCAASPYPASKRALHRRIVAAGAVLSELAPGSTVRRWMFPARNRIIAALAGMTVVVEAGGRSGALVTAAVAAELRREVGAVPGRITAPMARGANDLLAAGARVVRGPEDVLDALFGSDRSALVAVPPRAPLEPELERLVGALANGASTAAAMRRAGLDAGDGLAALAELELEGRVRRGAGGRYVVIPP